MKTTGLSWQLARECWQLPRGGAIMGILNVTPDSFSDGGRYSGVEDAVAYARRMWLDGADMIDIGGESNRPGSAGVEDAEELRRVLPVIEALRSKYPEMRLSVDTRHASVARAALEAGVDVVNDITGLTNPAMRAVCAEFPCGVVLMHMQGTPKTMQVAPHYDDVVAEVRDFFEQQVALAEADGIAQERICLDPGIGFGKSLEHNLALIQHLETLRVQQLPLLMALSRKGFIRALWEDADFVLQSPWPTVVMSLMAAQSGADMHRVHDVAELRRALQLRAAVYCL